MSKLFDKLKRRVTLKDQPNLSTSSTSGSSSGFHSLFGGPSYPISPVASASQPFTSNPFLCDQCHNKPKRSFNDYCSAACEEQAGVMIQRFDEWESCKYCGMHAKVNKNGFCSPECQKLDRAPHSSKSLFMPRQSHLSTCQTCLIAPALPHDEYCSAECRAVSFGSPCILDGCTSQAALPDRFCSKGHASMAVINGQISGCDVCEMMPKLQDSDYCSENCKGLADRQTSTEGKASGPTSRMASPVTRSDRDPFDVNGGFERTNPFHQPPQRALSLGSLAITPVPVPVVAKGNLSPIGSRTEVASPISDRGLETRQIVYDSTRQSDKGKWVPSPPISSPAPPSPGSSSGSSGFVSRSGFQYGTIQPTTTPGQDTKSESSDHPQDLDDAHLERQSIYDFDPYVSDEEDDGEPSKRPDNDGLSSDEDEDAVGPFTPNLSSPFPPAAGPPENVSGPPKLGTKSSDSASAPSTSIWDEPWGSPPPYSPGPVFAPSASASASVSPMISKVVQAIPFASSSIPATPRTAQMGAAPPPSNPFSLHPVARYASAPPVQQQGQSAPQADIIFNAFDHPWYGFSNFSLYGITFEGKWYATAEHLFQALKFLEHRPDLADRVRTVSTRPQDAFDTAHQLAKHARQDWNQVNIPMMEAVLKLKFSQHSDLRQLLLSTGDAELVNDSENPFWGVGKDGKGRNELGFVLMALRDSLDPNAPAGPPPPNFPSNSGPSGQRSNQPSGPSPPQDPRTLASPGGPRCRIQGCKYAPYDQNAKYCNNDHRKQAVSDGLEVPCILCKKFPKALHHYCGKKCASSASSRAPVIIPVPRDDPKFLDIHKQFNASWRHQNKPLPAVQHVFKIVQTDALMQEYIDYRARVEREGKFQAKRRAIGNECRRWHGTRRACTLGDDPKVCTPCKASNCALCSILRTSFQVSRTGTAPGRTFERFGKGIYTSSTSSKSDDYSSNLCNSRLKAILLTTVVVGKGYKVAANNTQLLAPPQGYHSVLGEKGGALNFDEVVVYHNSAIRAAWLVMYKP